MRISRLRVENFRSIKNLDLELGETTVFIGANNAGKSAILDAVRIALTRRWGQRGTGFTEHDVYCPTPGDDPRTLPPVRIEIVLEDDQAEAWPEDMVAALSDIMVLGSSGSNVITLRITCLWNEEKETFEPAWEFLDASGNPLGAQRARAINLSGFFNYLPLFWLGALRDAIEEFGPRSTYWGRLLRSIKVPKVMRGEIKDALDALDAKLLAADPRLASIADTVGQATHVAINEGPGSARLRMLPLDVWELLSRAGLVMRNEEARPWLPLDHHGQGLQSLSVIFLFQAAVTQLLADEGNVGAEPVFAIEEPEAHLHPQAARTLWERISSLSGQKLVTTHSPYFVQHVPLGTLRIVRLKNGCTEISHLPSHETSTLPWNDSVAVFAANGAGTMFFKDPKTGNLASKTWFDGQVESGVLGCWPNDPGAAGKLSEFRHACRVLVSAKDETDLAVAGRRLRGEVFFARRWLLVEGQSEHLLLHALGKALDWPLDQHGVAVVDFQNCGNPGIYAALADGFGIPWRMISDGDSESGSFRTQLLKRGFNAGDLSAHFLTLPPPNDLEDQLLADGHEALLREVLDEVGVSDASSCTLPELRTKLKKSKIGYMSVLGPRVASDPALANLMPVAFVTAVKDLIAGTL
jgi:putative ATP-dependent endonuclease of OLD family